MPIDPTPYLDSLLPFAACADPVAMACVLDRMADLALFHGRTLYAERLARQAEAVREALP